MRDLQRVDVNVAAFFADSFFEAQLLRGVRTNERGVVPGQFRKRLRQFLQPAVVGKATVVDCRVGAEDNLELPLSSWPALGRWRLAR